MSQLTPARRRLALFALALGGFGIGCTEFASMGLLPQIAQNLLPDLYGVSSEIGIARAGWLVSAYAVGVVVGAPVISLFAAKSSRTTMLFVMAVALLVGNLASALVPTFTSLLGLRFLAGIPHGAYFGLASLVAATVMGPGNQAKGVALALSGLTVANILGVPAMTAVGQTYGWRMAYIAVAVIFAVTALGVWLTVPRQEPLVGANRRRELRAFALPQVWIVVGIAGIGFGGFFAIYSYLTQMSRELTGLSEPAIPWLLAVVGVGMTLGNILGGISADHSAKRTMAVGFPSLTAALLLFGVLVGSPVGIFFAAFLMALTNSFIMPSIQSWLITAAGPAQLMGASLNHAAFNVANSIGALLGGAVISAGFGYRSTAVVAAVLAVTGGLLTLGGVRRQKLDRRRRLEAGLPVTASQQAV